jgi:DNA-binding NarL/FixJ family response regulator
MLPSILLIEDQLMFIELLLPRLRQQYQVETAQTPAIALAKLERQKFDLALLDLKLDNSPALEGLNLLPAIEQNGAQAIVISAHCFGSAQLVCQRSGVVGFVDKAGSADDLLPAIATVLAGQPSLPPDWGEGGPDELPELNNSCRKILARLMEDPALSNHEISQKINVSLSLVKHSNRVMFDLFDCKTRHQLVNEARRRGYRPDLQLAKRRKK